MNRTARIAELEVRCDRAGVEMPGRELTSRDEHEGQREERRVTGHIEEESSSPAPSPDGIVRDLILEVARALVDDGDGVAVHEVVGSTTTVYELSVGPGEVGKIIGRSGRTLRAFRTIVAAVGTKYSRKSILEVLE